MLDLAKLTKKIHAATGAEKQATVAGITYAFRLHSQEQQTVLDTVYEEISGYPEGSDERAIKSQELTSRAIAYALTSIDGEEVPDTFGDGTHRDKALPAAVAKWPEVVTDILFKVVLNMRSEYTRKVKESIKFDWFIASDPSLAIAPEETSKLAKEEQYEVAAEKARAVLEEQATS